MTGAERALQTYYSQHIAQNMLDAAGPARLGDGIRVSVSVARRMFIASNLNSADGPYVSYARRRIIRLPHRG
jgi:hypothetical protein